PQGRVLASSVPDVIPAGAAAGKLTRGFMAPEALKAILSSTPASGTLHGKLVWATAPVRPPKAVLTQKAAGNLDGLKASGGPLALGTVYVQVPDAAPTVFDFGALRPLLQAGLILLGVS